MPLIVQWAYVIAKEQKKPHSRLGEFQTSWNRLSVTIYDIIPVWHECCVCESLKRTLKNKRNVVVGYKLVHFERHALLLFLRNSAVEM